MSAASSPLWRARSISCPPPEGPHPRLARAAEAGDHLAKLVLSEVGTYLGIALASYINILNPELIVIGGGIANAGELLLEPARNEMKKRAYTVPAQTVRVVRAKLLNDAGILGSASIAVNNLSQ